LILVRSIYMTSDDREAGRLASFSVAAPGRCPRIAGLEIAASYEPLGRAGGDLYDLFL